MLWCRSVGIVPEPGFGNRPGKGRVDFEVTYLFSQVRSWAFSCMSSDLRIQACMI